MWGSEGKKEKEKRKVRERKVIKRRGKRGKERGNYGRRWKGRECEGK